jgi:DNA-binding transcriptional regulator YiaG
MKKVGRKITKQAMHTKPYHYRGCGLDNVFLHGGVNYLDTPRGKAVHIENIEGLHRAIGYWLVHEKKNLTGKEFRFLRNEINLTQQNVAALLNTDAQNVGRWEREEAEKVPGPAQVVIRLLYDEQVNGNKAIIEPLRRLAKLDEQFGEDDEVKFTSGPRGWSVAA